MMTSTINYSGSRTFNAMIETAKNDSEGFDVIKILQLVIASLGITTNLIVVVVFLNHKKLRRKIPNICIINQVSAIISGNKNAFQSEAHRLRRDRNYRHFQFDSGITLTLILTKS